MLDTSTKMIFFRVGWMEKYQGKRNGDKILWGGSYVVENDFGHEVYNYLSYKGYMYGYVEPPHGGDINLDRIGVSKGQNSIDNILVVWVARRKSGGVFIVGWYNNATIYRFWQEPEDSKRQYKGDMIGFRVKAREEDCVLLPIDRRILKIPTGTGGMGQSNIWYADAKGHQAFRDKVLEFINSGGKNLKSQAKNTVAPKNNDPLERAKVEEVAVKMAVDYYQNQGYEVKSVEKDNVGWDLEGYINNELLIRIEVKGLSGKSPVFELTPNEYSMLKKFEDTYRLCVVTSALKNPMLHVYYYSTDAGEWQDEKGDTLVIKELVSARLELKK